MTGWFPSRCFVIPKRANAISTVILMTYVAFSCFGGPLHHWTHHNSCQNGFGAVGSCDNVSSSSVRHCCCSHDGSKTKPRPKVAKVCSPNLAAQESSPEKQFESRSQPCDICSQLSLLNQSWTAIESVSYPATDVQSIVQEIQARGRSCSLIHPRSRSPPMSRYA